MKIAVFSTKSYDREFLDRFNPGGRYELSYFEDPLNKDTAILAQEATAVCAFVNDRIDAETLRRLSGHGIKIIAFRCAGFNNIDLEAAARFNIKVVRVPAYSPHAVAEHAVAMILTLNRKTHKAYNRVRENNFTVEKLLGFNLYGKTVGVIGTGKIGECFATIMLGFGCRVIACDMVVSPLLKKSGVEYLPIGEIFRQSDIISLHCPLTKSTHHLINKEAFEKMKKGMMLINTSRGAVIDTADAIDALKNETLGYLGIDVYEQEESLFFRDLSENIIQDDVIARLLSFPNVLITAHQGFFTREALDQIAATTFGNLEAFEKGEKLVNEVVFEKTSN